MTRIFVCDDSASSCRLVGFWLEAHDDLELVEYGLTRSEALTGLAVTEPDVVVLDTMTHHGDRISIANVRSTLPGARVLVYSGYPPEIAEGMLPGADRYLHKDDGEPALVAALRDLAEPVQAT